MVLNQVLAAQIHKSNQALDLIVESLEPFLASQLALIDQEVEAQTLKALDEKSVSLLTELGVVTQDGGKTVFTELGQAVAIRCRYMSQPI